MTLYLTVGLPGAGKTTRAKELEVRESALRLTPDDWYLAVFDADSPIRWRSAERVVQRDRLEGKLVEIGLQAARLGLDVVLDLGVWTKDERSALRWMAESVGTRTVLVYLPVTFEQQRARITGRYEGAPGHFQISDADLEGWRTQFEVPDEEELSGSSIPAVPSGFTSWSTWASARWPSLADQH